MLHTPDFVNIKNTHETKIFIEKDLQNVSNCFAVFTTEKGSMKDITVSC